MSIVRTVEALLIPFSCYQGHLFCYSILCVCKHLVIIQHVHGNNEKKGAEKDADTKHKLLKEPITATIKTISMQICAKLTWQQSYRRI